MKEALDHLVEKLDGLAPTAALVLGSGLGGLAGPAGALVLAENALHAEH